MQRIDAETTSERLMTFKQSASMGDPAALVLYGLRDGYLMGIAIFAGCAPET